MWWNTCSSLSCKTSLSHNAIYLPKVSIIVSITALTVATVLQWAMYIGRNASPAKILTSIKSTMVLCSNCFCISIRWLTQIRCTVWCIIHCIHNTLWAVRYTSLHSTCCNAHCTGESGAQIELWLKFSVIMGRLLTFSCQYRQAQCSLLSTIVQ